MREPTHDYQMHARRMNDRDFLMWIHARLEHVHGERPTFDYMHKLRAIIRSIPADRRTPNCNSCNSLEQLQIDLSDTQKDNRR